MHTNMTGGPHDRPRTWKNMEESRKCGDDGGTGIGAGHRCRCVGKVGHESFGNRGMVHGCECGALWSEKEVSVPLQGDATKLAEQLKEARDKK